MINMPMGVQEPFGIDGLLFYPRAVYDLAGSAWIFALWLLSLTVAFAYRGDRKVRFLLFLVIVQMALGTFHHTKFVRHILPILPPLVLLTGFVLAEGWDLLRRNFNRAGIYLAILIWGALLLHAGTLGLGSMHPYTADGGKEVSDFIASAVRDKGPAFVLGTRSLHAPTPPLLDWHLIVEEQLMTIHQAGSLAQYEENHRLLKWLQDLKAPSWLAGAIESLLTRFDHPSMGRTIYTGLPPDSAYSLTREGLDLFLREVFLRSPCRTLVLVTPLSDPSAVFEASLDLELQASGMHRLSTKFFNSAQTRVDVYEKVSRDSP